MCILYTQSPLPSLYLIQLSSKPWCFFCCVSRGLPFNISVSRCAMKRQTCHISAIISLRGEVSMCSSRSKRSPCKSQLAIAVRRSADPHQASSHLAVHSRISPFIIFIRPICSRPTLVSRKNTEVQNHKVPIEYMEQKQAENTYLR